MRSSAASRASGVEGESQCSAVHPLPPSFSFVSFLITFFYDGHENNQGDMHKVDHVCLSVPIGRGQHAGFHS